jgi:flavorubredoxin
VTTGRAAFPREIAPGVHWLGACSENVVGGQVFHVHLGQYLILGTAKTLLIDTGMPNFWPEVSAQLHAVLGGRPLDYLMPTHPEVPHVSALPYVLDAYPDCRLIGDSRDYRLYFPRYYPRMVHAAAGDEIDLGGKTLVFVEAVMKDLPNTLWAYERSERVLFVCDGFAFMHAGAEQPEADGEAEALHRPGQCALFTSEMAEAIKVDQASFILQRALYWSRYVDADVLFRRIERLIQAYPARLIAPAHGNVIDNPAVVFPTIRMAHEAANAST